MNNKKIHKTLQELKIITKYGITGMCLLMTIHCGLLYLGYEIFLVHFSFIAFLCLLGIKLSSIFNLCWVHKINVVYSLSIIICTLMRRIHAFESFGIGINRARVVMFAIGCVIILLNVWKLIKSKKNLSKNCWC